MKRKKKGPLQEFALTSTEVQTALLDYLIRHRGLKRAKHFFMETRMNEEMAQVKVWEDLAES